jgi:hypothetical protein
MLLLNLLRQQQAVGDYPQVRPNGREQDKTFSPAHHWI